MSKKIIFTISTLVIISIITITFFLVKQNTDKQEPLLNPEVKTKSSPQPTQPEEQKQDNSEDLDIPTTTQPQVKNYENITEVYCSTNGPYDREVEYYRDNDHVYDKDKNIIPLADPETYDYPCSSLISKDDKHVFFKQVVIENADSDTYTLIPTYQNGIRSLADVYYGKDNQNVYYQKGQVQNADLETFEIIHEFLPYAKDKNHVFFEENIIEKASSNGFEVLTNQLEPNYSRDKENVFYADKLVANADRETFEVFLPSGDFAYAKDAQNVYYAGNKTISAKPDTFELKGGSVAGDSQSTYCKGELLFNSSIHEFKNLYVDKKGYNIQYMTNGNNIVDIYECEIHPSTFIPEDGWSE